MRLPGIIPGRDSGSETPGGIFRLKLPLVKKKLSSTMLHSPCLLIEKRFVAPVWKIRRYVSYGFRDAHHGAGR